MKVVATLVGVMFAIFFFAGLFAPGEPIADPNVITYAKIEKEIGCRGSTTDVQRNDAWLRYKNQ